MTTYLVTRHPGTRLWAEIMAKHDRLPFRIDEVLEHLDPERLKKGDVVVGTLPLHVAAALHARGVKFWSLDIDVPETERGKELSGVQLCAYNARFSLYQVKLKESELLQATDAPKASKPQPSLTLIPVSGQLAPGAIGWLHARTEEVWLLASKAMSAQALRLKKWFEKQPKPPKVQIVDWNDADFASLLADAEAWAGKLVLEDRPKVVINLTGGTKLMPMALQRAFGKRSDAFAGRLHGPYVDTQHKRLEDLLSNHQHAQPLQSVLNISDMLTLNGFEARGADSARRDYDRWLERESLFRNMMSKAADSWRSEWYCLLDCAEMLMKGGFEGKNRPSYLERFADSKWTGSEAFPRFIIKNKEANGKKWQDLSRALQGEFGEALHQHGVVRWELDSTGRRLDLRFDLSRMDELAFAKGAWMEAWLASLFVDAGVDDWAQGLHVLRDGVENEFDLVAACGNRMLLVEVKTGNLARGGHEQSRGTEAVYRLDAVGERLGRDFNERWLVSLQKLEKQDRGRADKHGVKVFERLSGPHEVKKAIESWIQSSRLERSNGFRRSDFQPAPIKSRRKRSGGGSRSNAQPPAPASRTRKPRGPATAPIGEKLAQALTADKRGKR